MNYKNTAIGEITTQAKYDMDLIQQDVEQKKWDSVINGALYAALKHALQTKHDIRTCACVGCEDARATFCLVEKG